MIVKNARINSGVTFSGKSFLITSPTTLSWASAPLCFFSALGSDLVHHPAISVSYHRDSVPTLGKEWPESQIHLGLLSSKILPPSMHSTGVCRNKDLIGGERYRLQE